MSRLILQIGFGGYYVFMFLHVFKGI